MAITSDNIIYFLLEHGLITNESAAEGDFILVDESSRNHNFKIIRRRYQSYFIKQPQQSDPQALAFLAREADCYWLTAHEPGFSSLTPLVPRMFLYDPVRCVLIIELLLGAENLSGLHRRSGQFPLAAAAQLGEVLGKYHRLISLPTNSSKEGIFPKSAPWILSAHHLANSPIPTAGGSNKQILQIINRHDEFHKYLDELRADWRTDSFIHGDIKWENCLLYEYEGKSQLKIVDWETADFGDPAWDVGAVFQAYLTFWIMSIPISGKMTPDIFLQLAPYPIEAMQPAIRAFWLAYLNAGGIDVKLSQNLAIRSIRYGAARMLQTAYEHMFHTPQVTANAISLLQVALNIFKDPLEGVRELLNI